MDDVKKSLENSHANARQIKMNVKVDDAIAKGVYSNTAFMHNNENEFVLDFLFAEPSTGQGQAHVVSRVITNPRSAKQLAMGLKSLVDRYEEHFGEIVISKAPPVAPPRNYN